MATLELKTGCILELDKEKGLITIVSETPRSIHVNELVAAAHDDYSADFSGLVKIVEAGIFEDEPKWFSCDIHNNIYVQSDHATGCYYDEELKFIDRIIIQDAHGKTIAIDVDIVSQMEAGDDIILNEKWNLTVRCVRTHTMKFFLEMCKAKDIDLDNVTNEDIAKLLETRYFAKPTTSKVLLEREGTCFHLREG